MVGAARPPASTSWDAQRAKAKGLKAQLDTKMLELGRLAGRMDKATASSSEATPASAAPVVAEVATLRDEIQLCLTELKDSSESLSRLAASGSQTAQATRFNESHQELTRDFKRVVQSIDQQLKHARLLPGRGARKDASRDDEEAGLMRERGSLDATLSMTDEVLASAQATHDRLVSQRGMLGAVSGKVGMLASKFPALNTLINGIHDKKKREQMVLSFTVACCTIFTCWYKFRD